MQKQLLAALVASIVASQAMAIEIVNDGTNTFSIGGRIGLQTQTKSSRTNTINDGSRINLNFEHKVTPETSVIAVAEWGFNPMNQYDNAAGVTETSNNLFNNRLGYVGVNNNEFGSFAFGKQWSVYYDVAGWTDNYAIGGGKALGVYNTITTDGGFSGTGRADNALTYRFNKYGVHAGVQYQLSGTNYDETTTGDVNSLKRKNSYQASASYDVMPGLTAGGAYSQAKIKGVTTANSLTSRAGVLGVKYDHEGIYAAASYGQFRNHTSVASGQATGSGIVADNINLDKKSSGVELYGKYPVAQIADGTLAVEGGWNNLKVKKDSTDAASKAKLDLRTIGTIYNFGPMEVAAEYTWDQSKNNAGEKTPDHYLNVIGRYYF